ncbi:endonuclease/exonuclease/phosphatase family protein [Mangrovimonas sp. AS39]|uniref:endonuclease/exonuclease/phosphatase family protein n=1 Tax=Mangrovimonas futianensis TaxID=2895523 RepID=UPI001E2A9712|nr:endonuclease/exonuclease/phosphatase family protein [Mangrovimonas futianensis]MCF1190039.1 endonuclease/exonuclease/phosphatase family protein [Mangrovimonas futianensis]MCF1194210.1 endonuclease/exonuclease/phosphatase family protein [Mangrovimonas futianensis]
MKKIVTGIFMLLVVLAQSQELKVMTYNIKLDYPKEGENSWANRKPFFINQIKFHEPDVMGVQEAMPNQMKDMSLLLPEYTSLGVGRDDGKDEGEYSAIFYKKKKFKVLESSTFWLSETPEKVGMGWDAVCNRVCTYALLQNQDTDEKFWVFNTHFDHVGKEARKNSALLIIGKIQELNKERLPVILTGDFNMEPEHESIQYILRTLKDSKTISNLDFGPTGTFNGFHFNEPVTRRIDFIFVSENIQVNKYAVLSDNWDLRYPSDHFPIVVELHLN